MNYSPASKAIPSEVDMTGTNAVATGPRRVTSQILFRGHDELRILHAGQEYRLTVTRQGKLILTK